MCVLYLTHYPYFFENGAYTVKKEASDDQKNKYSTKKYVELSLSFIKSRANCKQFIAGIVSACKVLLLELLNTMLFLVGC